MPGGDRTGPLGTGAKTGRGAGYCSGNNRAGGLGLGQGRGVGGGRGWRSGPGAGRAAWCRRDPDADPTAGIAAEKSMLQRRKDALLRQLEAVRNRLRQMGTTDDSE